MKNPFKAGTQNYRLFERLKQGPVTNVEIVHEMRILNSTGRVSNLRDKGLNVPGKPRPDLGDGVWQYTLVA